MEIRPPAAFVTILFASLLFPYLTIFAQETKFIEKKTGNIQEKYSVLKENSDIKHGPYTRFVETLDLSMRTMPTIVLEKGQYSQGQKIGLWEQYRALPSRYGILNPVVSRGNYANGKKNGIWTYYHIDFIFEQLEAKMLSLGIDTSKFVFDPQNPPIWIAGSYLNDKRIGEWFTVDRAGNLCQKYNFSKKILYRDITISDSLMANINRRALFLGTDAELNNYLSANMNSLSLPQFSDTTSVIASFTIETDGKISNTVVSKNPFSKEYGDELLRLIALLDGQWIPAVKEGVVTPFVHTIAWDFIPLAKSDYRGTRAVKASGRLRFRLL